jgi:hypothetical protein
MGLGLDMVEALIRENAYKPIGGEVVLTGKYAKLWSVWSVDQQRKKTADVVADLKPGFADGRLPDPMTASRSYNIRVVREARLK